MALYNCLPIYFVLIHSQTPSDTTQTPSRHHPDTRRHHPDTPRHTSFYTIEGTRRKGFICVSWPNIFSNISFIGSTPDTLRHLPDTTKHNPDTSRPRRLYAIEGAGSKGNVSIMSYHELLQIDLLLTHPPDNPRHHRYPQTPSRHHPDTPRQRDFLYSRVLEEEAIFEYLHFNMKFCH